MVGGSAPDCPPKDRMASPNPARGGPVGNSDLPDRLRAAPAVDWVQVAAAPG